jgi:uncharacterized protein YodC (DUF2158 family)
MTDTPAFQLGDVVKMKRMLGPHMAVWRIRRDTSKLVDCIWFDAHGIVQRDCFDAFMLELVRTP